MPRVRGEVLRSFLSLGKDFQFEVYETLAFDFVVSRSKLQGLFFFDYLEEFDVGSPDNSTRSSLTSWEVTIFSLD